MRLSEIFTVPTPRPQLATAAAAAGAVTQCSASAGAHLFSPHCAAVILLAMRRVIGAGRHLKGKGNVFYMVP